jgi:hypothetical protein
MKPLKTLFLAWHDHARRKWYPVARLCVRPQYEFVYTRGALEANRESGFQPVPPFDDFHGVYVSDALFPLFTNRLPSRDRPDYAQFVQCLNMPQDEDDPVAILARSGGRRATDSFEVFPCPERKPDGSYHIHFFAHGLRHLPESSLARIGAFRGGEPLLLAHDFQNPHDAHALLLRTNDTFPEDRYIVGYCPRYILHDAFSLLLTCPDMVHVNVERLNPPPAPITHRLLCSLSACWPTEFRPCAAREYQPIAENAEPCSCN